MAGCDSPTCHSATLGTVNSDGAWCYGYRWDGLPTSTPWLSRASGPGRGILVVQQVSAHADPPPDRDGRRITFPLLTGGFLTVDRTAATATYRTPSPIDAEELIHPYLVPAAAAFSSWSGREAYHAGAVVIDGQALAVVGGKQAGKSTTLAVLASLGCAVLTDDLLVLDGHQVLAGPRLIDLRASAGKRLGVAHELSSAREGGRWRLPLGPAPEAELAGWIYLRWGPTVALRALGLDERVRRLIDLVPTESRAVLDLATLPAYELERPKEWDELARAVDLLLLRLS